MNFKLLQSGHVTFIFNLFTIFVFLAQTVSTTIINSHLCHGKRSRANESNSYHECVAIMEKTMTKKGKANESRWSMHWYGLSIDWFRCDTKDTFFTVSLNRTNRTIFLTTHLYATIWNFILSRFFGLFSVTNIKYPTVYYYISILIIRQMMNNGNFHLIYMQLWNYLWVSSTSAIFVCIGQICRFLHLFNTKNQLFICAAL